MSTIPYVRTECSHRRTKSETRRPTLRVTRTGHKPCGRWSIAKLARERGGELLKLAEELEG